MGQQLKAFIIAEYICYFNALQHSTEDKLLGAYELGFYIRIITSGL